MVMLDGTKTLSDAGMMNGFVMFVYIICAVLCFSLMLSRHYSCLPDGNIVPNSAEG